MSAYQNQYYSAVALFRAAAALHAAAERMRAAAKSLHDWLERRRRAAIALDEFATMSDRTLLDLGLSRADVLRVAWGAPDRNRELI
jgi:uncharacterized protein YjiS (DUF1127 family)